MLIKMEGDVPDGKRVEHILLRIVAQLQATVHRFDLYQCDKMCQTYAANIKEVARGKTHH